MEIHGIPQQDVTLDGPGTRCWFLTPDVCPLLAAHGLARVGIDDSDAGYQRVRLRPAGSFILESSEGQGRILLEGRWQNTVEGGVVMAPPRALNAFHTPEGHRWKIAYARYDEPPGVHPLIDAGSPLRLSGHTQLTRALSGLRDEW
ncbi:MAG: chbR, partial [Verrucomicrobiales bacterium]|nr:chbR [Verrucomicrobiales bacterium]